MTSKREVVVSGEPIWLCGITGEVRGEKKWSESRTQSNLPGQMNWNPHQPSIATTVNTRHEFWLVASDGEERLVSFFNSGVSVRDGQIVTAIWGASAKNQTGTYLMLQNNSAQTNTFLYTDAKVLLTKMGLSSPFGLFVAAGIAALVVFTIIAGVKGFLFGLAVFAALAAFGSNKRMTKAREVKEAIREAMNLEVQSYRGIMASTQARIAG